MYNILNECKNIFLYLCVTKIGLVYMHVSMSDYICVNDKTLEVSVSFGIKIKVMIFNLINYNFFNIKNLLGT